MQYNFYICEKYRNMANIIKVFHLELNGEHYYFGSKKALCDAFSKEDIGITYPSLRNYALSPSNPYVNKKKNCIIREGILGTAPKKSSDLDFDFIM